MTAGSEHSSEAVWTVDDQRRVLQDYSDHFLADVFEEQSVGNRPTFDVYLAAVVLGWNIRIARTIKGALRMHEDGLQSEATPLVRAVFEHASAARWVVGNPDVAADVLDHHHKTYASKLKGAGDRADWEVGELVSSLQPTAKPESFESFDNTTDMVKTVLGLGAEVSYRLLCSFTHPTLNTAADYWLGRNGNNAVQGRLSLENRPVIPMLETLRLSAQAAACSLSECMELPDKLIDLIVELEPRVASRTGAGGVEQS